MEIIVVIGYSLSLILIFFFSIGQLNLAIHYKKKKSENGRLADPSVWPKVTVQLPIYNEKYVVQRLIDCVAKLDYPRDRLEIQVLDDSTDETSEIIARLITQYSETGLAIEHIQMGTQRRL